ncbi:maleylacetate reductase [Alteribacillus persepolensis]|uniref:Maleylacetate reductase n=1 Tax=Alteribacillus persepolensis TaxID=568899 RepID=A0A1G7Y5W2_9BACI|nr:maleylacetate reductase [Alteribacillus persepolensis]SDG91759.1 maleylacetate reductase [Alteribacillus persepolensis]
MENFIYEQQAAKIVFGRGKRKSVKEEVKRLGANRALVISTQGRKKEAEEIAACLEEVSAGLHDKARQHVPKENVTDVVQEMKDVQADTLVAVGGGSAIGLAKAAVLQLNMPIVAVPTTYSGSEMTAVWGITSHGKKQTGKDTACQPKTVIYDPELTVTMPPSLSLTSGVNAMAHCVEALYASNENPITSLMAEEGIRALHESLGNIVRNPHDMEARSLALYGSWLSGSALASVGMALHHKLCHVLGGTCQLPHAETHTVVLPHALEYNRPDVPKAIQAVARALQTGEQHVPSKLFTFIKDNGGPTSLEEIGMKKGDIDKAAELATEKAYDNPREVTKEGMKKLLTQAFAGKQPLCS